MKPQIVPLDPQPVRLQNIWAWRRDGKPTESSWTVGWVQKETECSLMSLYCSVPRSKLAKVECKLIDGVWSWVVHDYAALAPSYLITEKNDNCGFWNSEKRGPATSGDVIEVIDKGSFISYKVRGDRGMGYGIQPETFRDRLDQGMAVPIESDVYKAHRAKLISLGIESDWSTMQIPQPTHTPVVLQFDIQHEDWT